MLRIRETENEEVSDRFEGTFWCTCERCEIMPTQRECVCCREQPEAENKMEDRILSLYCIGRSKRKNNFLCKFLLHIVRRFNKAVSSYFLPQLFVFLFYFLALTPRDFLHHCKWIFNCLFKRGVKGTLRWNNLEQHLVLVSSFLSSHPTFLIWVFVTILCEVFIINLNIFTIFLVSIFYSQTLLYGGTASASNRRSLARKRWSAFVRCGQADAYILQFALGRCLWVAVCFLSPLPTLTLSFFHSFNRLSDASSEQCSVSAVFGPRQCLKYPHNRSTSFLCDLVRDNASVRDRIRSHLDCSPSCSFPPQPSCSDKPADIPGRPPTRRPAPAAGAFVGRIVFK